MLRLCKVGLFVCGIGLGTYSAYGAFRFNVGMSGDYGFASVMVMLTAGCWFIPPVTLHWWREGKKRLVVVWAIAWAAMIFVVVANAAGFTVGNRRTVVSDREQEI
jgi:hypothetical protein